MHLRNTLATAALLALSHAKACPPLGAVLPPPQAPSKSEDVKAVINKLTAGLDMKLSAQLNTSGVSIGVKSLHEDDLLFNYHFTPPVLSGIGTESIDEHTIYRVGSISKMMPALAVIQSSDVDLDASVLKYLPELDNEGSNPIKNIQWKDVTVRSLTSHLSGLATDLATDLAVFPTGPWTAMGLPEVANGTGPSCSGLPGTKACTKKDLIDDINRSQAVFLPHTSPSYSNIGFAVLGLVIEAATGQKFEDFIEENIWKVAGMKSTSFYGPFDSFEKVGFVPKGESTWNSTLGVFEAAGGMFSNTIDLIAFAEAIATNKLLSADQTRQWMKPQAHTSSLGLSVGGPWEILRADNITSDGRVVDVYTKSGDLGLYHALLGIVPDYDIVVSVIAGGAEVSLNPYARSLIFSSVIKALVPAIEVAGKEEVSSKTGFVGTFSDDATNSSLTLKLEDGSGLLIESFSVRGFDVLGNIASYSLAAAESGHEGSGDAYVEGRMYPTDITTSRGTKNGTTESAWRAVFDSVTPEQRASLDKSLFNIDGSCESWFSIDRSAYNFLSLGEFVFVQGSDGTVEAVKNPAFNVTLTKVSGGDNDGGHSGDDGSGSTVPPTGSGSTLNSSGIRTFVFAVGTVLIVTSIL